MLVVQAAEDPLLSEMSLCADSFGTVFQKWAVGTAAPLHTPLFPGLLLPPLGSVLPLPPCSQGLPKLLWKSCAGAGICWRGHNETRGRA